MVFKGPFQPKAFYDSIILLTQDGIQLVNVPSCVFCVKELPSPVSSASLWSLIQLPWCQLRHPMESVASLGAGR